MSIRFSHLTRRYGPGGGVSGVSADIPRGTLCAVVGGNGAGKTTLLRCLAGLSRYDGDVSIAGRSPERAVRGAVAYLPQALVLPQLATVRELVGLFARVAAHAAELDRELVTVGPERTLGGLSGGELRRVALAALLAMRPAVFLLDEPLADLDRVGRGAVLSRIRSACDLGATALISSPAPDLTEIGAVVDRVLVLERGSLVADGPGRVVVARQVRSA